MRLTIEPCTIICLRTCTLGRAPRYRTVRTSKGGNIFCCPEHIGAQIKRVFRKLKEDDFLRGRSFEGFIDGAAAFFGRAQAVQPFRKGNGRAQLSFLHLLSIKAGHPLALVKIRPAEFLAAMIASFNGNLRPLIAEPTRLRA